MTNANRSPRRWLLLLAAGTLLLLTTCRSETVEVTRIITETETEEIVVTRIVEVEGAGQDLLPTAGATAARPPATSAVTVSIASAANGDPCARPEGYSRELPEGGSGQSLLEPAPKDPLLFILGEDGEDITSPAFNPDDTMLLTGGDHVRLWDVASGKSLQTLTEETDFYQTAFSPDGALIAASQYDDIVHLWEAAGGVELPPIQVAGTSAAHRFSPDGRMLVIGISDVAESRFHLVDVATREERLITMAASDERLRFWQNYAFAFSPDGRLLATANGRVVHLWDTRVGEEVQRLAGHPVLGSGDGAQIASGHASTVFDLAFSPDGQVLLTAGADWSLRLWDVAGGEYLGCFSPPASPGSFYAVTFSPDGRLFAASMLGDELDQYVYVWQSEDGRLLYELEGDYRGGVAFDRAGSRMVTWAGTNLYLWNATTGAQITSLPHSGEIRRATFSNSGNELAVENWLFDHETGDSYASVWVWDARHPDLAPGAQE